MEKALLDLGVSFNLLLYAIYKQLGLEELEAIAIMLSLANCLIKVSRRVVVQPKKRSLVKLPQEQHQFLVPL